MYVCVLCVLCVLCVCAAREWLSKFSGKEGMWFERCLWRAIVWMQKARTHPRATHMFTVARVLTAVFK
jgi:beta-lactamase superfamily II metal-dependent hydrolase